MADDELLEESGLKENKSKKMLIYGGIGIVQVLVAFVLVYFVIFPKIQDSPEEAENSEATEEQNERTPLGVLHTISGLTVNPKNSNGTRFAVFEIVLEMPSEDLKNLVKQYEPVIVDKLLNYLRGKTVEELSYHSLTTDIKTDIMNIVNGILVDKKIINVYFTRFVLE